MLEAMTRWVYIGSFKSILHESLVRNLVKYLPASFRRSTLLLIPVGNLKGINYLRPFFLRIATVYQAWITRLWAKSSMLSLCRNHGSQFIYFMLKDIKIGEAIVAGQQLRCHETTTSDWRQPWRPVTKQSATIVSWWWWCRRIGQSFGLQGLTYYLI